MCGLVGIVSRKQAGFYHTDMEFMQKLLLLDSMRGEDSTGVFTVLKDKNVTITKVGSHPLHLFTTDSWSKHRGKAIQNGKIMIGHNRKATMGKVNSENAHPFHEGNIILVHNGTLRGGHKSMADVEVDSHAVCHSFNEKGAEETLKTLDAAFAFIWWDIDKERLFAVRNDERPLFIVTTEDHYVLCSEPWMAQSLLMRDSKKILSVEGLEPATLHEFDLNGNHTSTKVELRKNVVVHQHSSADYHDYYQRRRTAFNEGWDDTETVPTGKILGPIKSSTGTDSCGTQTPFDTVAAQMNAAPFARNAHYEKHENVLLKIEEVSSISTDAKWKVTGKIKEPGRPLLDFVGFIPKTDNINITDYKKVTCTGRIINFSKSSCGDSAWVSEIHIADDIKIHNTDIPLKMWNYVVHNVTCQKCASKINDEEAEFTSVTVRPSGEFRVTCADCIEDKLPKGEVQDVFTQRRLVALQNAKSVRNQPASSALVLVASDGKSTLH